MLTLEYHYLKRKDVRNVFMSVSKLWVWMEETETSPISFYTFPAQSEGLVWFLTQCMKNNETFQIKTNRSVWYNGDQYQVMSAFKYFPSIRCFSGELALFKVLYSNSHSLRLCHRVQCFKLHQNISHQYNLHNNLHVTLCLTHLSIIRFSVEAQWIEMLFFSRNVWS